jgi:hypothetical protein
MSTILPDGPLGAILEQALGSDRSYRLTLFDSDGNLVTGLPADAPLAAALWRGGDQAPVVAPAVQWIDPTQGTVLLVVSAADTAGLAVGTYRLRVTVAADGQTLVVFDGALRLTAAPGAAPPPPVYCGYEDLKLYAPWLDTLHDAAQEQTGFAGERARARQWLDDLILRQYRGGGGGVLGNGPGGGGGLWGARRSPGYSPFLVQQLQQDHLIVRPAVVEAVAQYALGLICQAQLGRGGWNDYARLASTFAAAAHNAALCLTAEIDTNDDGLAEVVIPLGTTNTFWA